VRTSGVLVAFAKAGAFAALTVFDATDRSLRGAATPDPAVVADLLSLHAEHLGFDAEVPPREQSRFPSPVVLDPERLGQLGRIDLNAELLNRRP
jgi:hypothetical protein